MEERINDIVSQEAIAQLERLADMLDKNTAKMTELIRTTNEYRVSMERADGTKEMAGSVTSLNDATNKLINTESERLNIERQIKAEGQKMLDVLTKEDIAIDAARDATKALGMDLMKLANEYQKAETEIKSITEEMKKLQKEQSNESTRTDKNADKLANYMIQLQQLKVANADRMQQIKTLSKLEAAGEGGYGNYQEMSQQLALYREAWRKLSEEQRNNSDVGKQLTIAINYLDEKLKALDKSVGNNQRNVGNYEVATTSLRTQMYKMRDEVMQLTMSLSGQEQEIAKQEQVVLNAAKAHGQTSDQYQTEKDRLEMLKQTYAETKQKIAEMTSQSQDMKKVFYDVNKEISEIASPNTGLKAVSQGAALVADSYTIAKASMSALGLESENFKVVFDKLRLLQLAVNSLTNIGNILYKNSALMLKLRALQEKIVLAVMRKKTIATVADTAAQQQNNAAMAQGGAAAGTLAAGEGAATAAAGALTTGVRAASAAIMNIPVIGWILAAVAALGTIIALVVKSRHEENELNKKLNERKQIYEGTKDVMNEVYSSTRKEVIEMENNVAQLSKLNKDSVQYKNTVKAIADQLGVNSDWLTKNIDKVQDLARAWMKVKIAQATSDAFIEKAAEQQVKTEEAILQIQRQENKERVKTLTDAGVKNAKALASALHQARRTGDWEEFNRQVEIARNNAADISKVYVEKANEATKAIESDMELLQEAQKQGSDKAIKNAEKEVDAKKKAEEYYLGILKQIEARKDDTLSKSAKGRITKLQSQEAKELAKYTQLTEEQRKVIKQYYSDLRLEIEQEEARKTAQLIFAANRVILESNLKMAEEKARQAGLTEEQLTENLISYETQRAELQREIRSKEFAERVKDLTKGSEEYIAVEKEFDKLREQDAWESEQRIKKIRQDGLKGQLDEVRKHYDSLRYLKTVSGGGILGEGDAMQFELQQAEEELRLFTQNEKYILENKLMTEEEYQLKSLELMANVSQKKRAILDEERNAYKELAQAIGGAFISIGNAVADGMTNQVQQVRLQQALAMAQLLLSQGVSLANAIEAGTKEGASKGSVVAMYGSIASAVGAVISQIITAKQAIDQAKTAMAQAEAYADGTDYHHGGAALVGEGEYPELVMANGKNFVVDKPTFFKSLPVGAKVIPITPDMSRGVDLSILEDGVRRLNDKSMVNINVGENVYAYIVKGANRARMLNKSFMH